MAATNALDNPATTAGPKFHPFSSISAPLSVNLSVVAATGFTILSKTTPYVNEIG